MGLLVFSSLRIAACNADPCPSPTGGVQAITRDAEEPPRGVHPARAIARGVPHDGHQTSLQVGDDQAPRLPARGDGLAVVVEDLHHNGGAVDLVQPWVVYVVIIIAALAVVRLREVWAGQRQRQRQANNAAVHRPVDQRLDGSVGESVLEQPGLISVEGFAREQEQSHVRMGLARAQDPFGELGHGGYRGEDHAGLELDNMRLHGLEVDVARDGELDSASRRRPSDDAITLLGCEDLVVAAGIALPEGGVVDDGDVAKCAVAVIDAAPSMGVIGRVGFDKFNQLTDGLVGQHAIGLDLSRSTHGR
ncbi:hypothetical protein PG993_010217 [Apiospora rasikravindrae]|uniref:Uncharacterized protein n=1 Tax=Apiospora rasikravindrae TaxID=990691 RepID=A0ABR1SLM4_9PEZI